VALRLKVRPAVFETAATGSIPATLANMPAIPPQRFTPLPTGGSAGGALAGAGGTLAGAGGTPGAAGGAGSGYGRSDYIQTYTPSPVPDWDERHYVMKNTEGQPVGIYKGPVDVTTVENFTLYMPDHDCTFQPLTFDVIHKMDYETHVAFETFPVLTVERHAAGGILLKIPRKLVKCE